MKKMFLVGVVVMVFLLSVVCVNAVSITIDTDNLDKNTAASVLQAEKNARQAATVATEKVFTADNVEKFADIGVKIGKVIAATCKELSIEVNEFVKTPVGMITMGLIVYKVVGEKLWSVIGGTLAWFAIVAVIFLSLRRFHMSERVVTNSDKENPRIEYVPRFEFESSDAKAVSACFHAGVFLVFTVTCLFIVFG